MSEFKRGKFITVHGIDGTGKTFPGIKANRFINWFIFSDESIDGKSKTKAYALFESFFKFIMI